MPGLASVAHEFESRGVQFFALTTWNDDKTKVEEWMRGLGVSGIQSGKADDKGVDKLHTLANRPLRGLPSTVFIGPDGKIRDVMGPSEEDEFRKAFTELVGPESGTSPDSNLEA